MKQLVVISRYNENIDWKQELKAPVLVYNKGNELQGSIPIPNEGREGETWLRYIINNYHQLPENIVFLQGNPFDHCRDVISIVNHAEVQNKLVALSNELLLSDENGAPHHPGLEVGKTYSTIFPHRRSGFLFAPGAQYIVPKSFIENKTIEWWLNLGLIYASTKDAPWVFERIWMYIFS